jgi:hypothetical protein
VKGSPEAVIDLCDHILVDGHEPAFTGEGAEGQLTFPASHR